ncbi:MAG TPA: DUF4178 domain-containing protein [Campylobacterales bacterium]|nr:DUF4178 domain-containing protein [Campylobacterales bacterium]
MKQDTPLYQATIEKTINCPQCGDSLPLYFRWTKLVQCPSCKSSIFLETLGAKVIGEASELSPEPSLLKLHEAIRIGTKTYLPLGKIRYSYGRGFWEEWFLRDTRNKEYWLSIDEGDFVLESKITTPDKLKNFDALKMGRKYGNYLVTELDEGECVGFAGELPKMVTVGAKHRYAHLSGTHASLMTVEQSPEGVEVYSGEWIDPFSIEKVYG